MVNEVRLNDRQGHHTTTRRELIRLHDGGNVIDTPGMKEIQLWAGMDDIDVAFADISDLACECRFNDCSHQAEIGCAVTAAVDSGVLSRSRLDSYIKMKRELSYTLARETQNAQVVEKKTRWKHIAKLQNRSTKTADLCTKSSHHFLCPLNLPDAIIRPARFDWSRSLKPSHACSSFCCKKLLV